MLKIVVQLIYLLWMDIFKAFDRVDHYKLLNILMNRSLPGLHIIKDFLERNIVVLLIS